MASNDEEENIMEDEKDFSQIYVPEGDTTCTLCYAEFLDPDDLKIHLDQVHKISTSVLRKCHFCTEEYSDFIAYAIHIRDYHLTSLKSCSSCWRVFNNIDELRNHSRKHIRKVGESINCSQCPRRYDDVLMLKRHEYEHMTNTEGAMLHEVLPYLSAVLKLKAITIMESAADIVYTCVGCEFSTDDMNNYIRHVQVNDCEVYVCHRCGSVFKKRKFIVKHLLTNCNMFGIRERKTQLCLDCNTYITTKTYKKHKVCCKPIKCYTCDIKFATMNDWSNHQSKEHAGMSVEVETCQFCWKRCVGSVAMKKHVDKIHKPEFHLYKYRCVYCSTVFKHPQKLFAHFVTQHKNISPFECKICNEKFRYRKKLTIHIKLKHDSVGFVEFDENYHVFFTDKQSEKPFVPKSIYVNEESDDSKSGNDLNSDFMNTDTEGNQTDVENQQKRKVRRKKTLTTDIIETEGHTESKKTKPNLKRKRTSDTRKKNNLATISIESSDDDEPLLVVKKRVKLQKKKSRIRVKKSSNLMNRELLTCKVCNKYCYTVQNYNHHISLHSKHEVKKCIKCSKIFKTKAKLNEHIATDHSSSKLTETLKSLLEKRKTGGTLSEDLPVAMKFRRTIKKVETEISTSTAKITEVDHKLSVQKFFENFVPEDTKCDSPIESTATIKLVNGYYREPAIKMTKFKPHPINTTLKLSMPVKFVDNYSEQVKVSIKIVEHHSETEENNDYYMDNYEENPDMERHDDSIPDVAEEVLLEGTEEIPKVNPNEISHKIVIPKLPTELTDIHIAHLLPQAPYFKIVKVKDVLESNEEEKEMPIPNAIKLADGTKYIITNPLAHLLGNEQEKVLESVKNKYYKPRNKNFHGMLAKALNMLDKPSYHRKKMKEEQVTEVFEEDN